MSRQKFFGNLPVFCALVLLCAWGQACKGKLPATSAMAAPIVLAATPTPTPCAYLFQDCESLSQGNGVFSANDATVLVSISPYNVTQGSHSLKISVPTGGSRNLINLTGFYPNRWSNVAKVVMDVTADAALVTGSYNQFSLAGQSYATAKYWSPLTTNMGVVSGSQSVTFLLDWSLGNILPTDVIDNLVMVWTTSGAGTGNFYVDNVRMFSATGDCLPPAPTTCGVMSSFESAFDNGTVSSGSGNVSLSYSPLHATLGNGALQVLLSVGGGVNLINWSGFFPNHWPDVMEIDMDVYVDPALIGAGYNQLSLVAQGTGSSWNPITSNVDVVAGAQTLTFPINWTLGTMNPLTATVTNLFLVWNAGGTGTGTFSIDDVRLRNSVSCVP